MPSKEPTPAGASGLLAIAEVVCEPRKFKFEFPNGSGTFHTVTLRPLSGAQLAEFDRLGPMSIKPPAAKRPKSDRPEDAYDHDDPKYVAEVTRAKREQTAYAFQHGIVPEPGQPLPESLTEAATWIHDKLPESVIQTLLGQIFQMSAGRVELASFTSAAA